MTPFHVQCQTCRTYLRVTKPEAIGLILGCPKCQGMVEVQPPPNWQDSTGEVPASQSPTTVAPAADVSELAEAQAAGSRWVVPGFAAGALVCAGLLSWLVWSQLREPDRTDQSPGIALASPPRAEIVSPPQENPTEVPPAEQPQQPRTENPPASPPSPLDPPAAVKPEQAPVEPVPPASAVVVPPANNSAPLEIVPSKPKLVLKPEQTPGTQPETPLIARGPEASPQSATQAVPLTEVEEKPVFNNPPMVEPAAVAPVLSPPVAAVPLTRTPLAPVNAKNLEQTLAAVAYEQVPLHAFLREMGELAGAEIGIDDQTLQRSGWRLNTPIRVQLQKVTVRGALQSALRPLELDLMIKENYLWVGHAAVAETTHLTRYPIDDLVNKDMAEADAAELAATVQRLVAPERWAGGKLDHGPGTLLITQTAAVHDELIVWFEKLRIARGLPLRTKYDPANSQLRRFAPQRFALTTRWQLAEPLLNKSVTASFLQPETLAEIINTLGRQTQAVVVWDLPALDAAGLSPDTLSAFSVNGTRLDQALEQLLDPLGLMLVPLDESSILLTTKTAAERRLLTERYSLARLAEQRRWGAEECEVIPGLRQELRARGLELPETVPLAWDRASRSLAVTASPLTHRALEKILGEVPQKPVAAAALLKK